LETYKIAVRDEIENEITDMVRQLNKNKRKSNGTTI